MGKPKYSFILPIYKVELYLRECIDSILRQKIDDFEVILVDDGSPDNCPTICDEYAKKDSRIKVIHKKNGGLCDARNAGLEIAKGKYILFIDSDDYIEDNYLEVIDKNIDDCDLLVFSYNNFYKNKIVKGYGMNAVLDSDKSQEILLDDNKIRGYVWNKVFKKSIIDKNKLSFDVNIKMCEDLLFCYQYINCINKINLIKNSLYNYRQRKSSSMARSIKKNVSSISVYNYILNHTSNNLVKSKCRSLYLKCYYKYIKYVDSNFFDIDLINDIKTNDLDNFSKSDKKIIFMYKYIPVARNIILKLKSFKNKPFV